MATHLLLNLQLIYHWSQLREDLVCLLVVFKLRRNKVCQVAERLGGIKDLFH
jgi:hypothetical protein